MIDSNPGEIPSAGPPGCSNEPIAKAPIGAWRAGFWPALVICYALLCGLVPSNAYGEEKRIALPNEPKVIVEGSIAPFTSMDASLGKVESKPNAKEPKKFDLIYTAPDSSAGKTAEVRYTVHGESQNKVLVEILATPSPWGDSYAPAFKVLFALFVLAVVLEWGLAVIFNWRPFLRYFDARGAKTVVTVLFALWFVNTFDLDVTSRLVSILWGATAASDWVSKFISALVLAGGSSGVNSMLIALGFRSVRTIETVQPKPPPTKAWISVSLRRQAADGPVDVLMKVDNGNFFLLTQISGKRQENPLLRFILRDTSRFPAYGGFTIEPGKTYELSVEGKDRAGNRIGPVPWGPYTPAAGAIIDVEVRL